MWLWIRRNRPILTRPIGRQEPERVLHRIFDETLGDRLALWRERAGVVAARLGGAEASHGSADAITDSLCPRQHVSFLALNGGNLLEIGRALTRLIRGES